MGRMFARVTTFLVDVREELKQVSWPSREELLGSALVVFVGVAAASLCDARLHLSIHVEAELGLDGKASKDRMIMAVWKTMS